MLEASLACTCCGKIYPVRCGIPVFVTSQEGEGHVAESFGFEWNLYHEGAFEDNAVFGRTPDEDVEYFFDAFAIDPEGLDGRSILDAGCGSGTLTMELARRYPETTIVGMDINLSTSATSSRTNCLASPTN